MATDILTMSLNGDAVAFEDFSNAMVNLKEIIKGLHEETAPNAQIKWVVDELKTSSVIATVRGVALSTEDLPAVERISDAYLEIGRKIIAGETLRNGRNVVNAVLNLRKMINGKITSIRFETPKNDYTIKDQTIPLELKEIWETETFGCIKGRVESISSRKSLHFTVYDYNDDHAISCYLPTGSDEKMRNVWGKLVYVEGLVKRDEDTDNVIIIRNISNVELINEGEPSAWREALGSIQ